MDILNNVLFNQLGVDLKHPLMRSEQEAEGDLIKLKEALADPEKSKLLLGEKWLFETVVNYLEKEINHAINILDT